MGVIGLCNKNGYCFLLTDDYITLGDFLVIFLQKSWDNRKSLKCISLIESVLGYVTSGFIAFGNLLQTSSPTSRYLSFNGSLSRNIKFIT